MGVREEYLSDTLAFLEKNETVLVILPQIPDDPPFISKTVATGLYTTLSVLTAVISLIVVIIAIVCLVFFIRLWGGFKFNLASVILMMHIVGNGLRALIFAIDYMGGHGIIT